MAYVKLRGELDPRVKVEGQNSYFAFLEEDRK